MARGENPGTILTIASSLTYDKDADFGHASAGKNLALAFDGSLAADGVAIAGSFVELHRDGKASVMIDGEPLILRKMGTDALAKGTLVVGADGTGKVKAAAASNAGTSAARFRVLEQLESGDNGRIKVIRA